ncbi:MAG: hypothetical protein WCK77_20470 [Verrucomicrobiota bacterium]
MSFEEKLLKRMEEIDRRIERLARAVENSAAARTVDDDGWTRIPRQAPGSRCAVSGWSWNTLARKIKAGQVRTKIVQGFRYYAAKDVNELINS